MLQFHMSAKFVNSINVAEGICFLFQENERPRTCVRYACELKSTQHYKVPRYSQKNRNCDLQIVIIVDL